MVPDLEHAPESPAGPLKNHRQNLTPFLIQWVWVGHESWHYISLILFFFFFAICFNQLPSNAETPGPGTTL